MQLTIRGVLRYGSAALLAVAMALLIVLLRGMAATGDAVKQLGAEERESAAAFELEINTLGTGLAVVAYLDSGDVAHRARVDKDRRDFATYLATYRQWADPDEQRLADRAEGLYREFDRLGVSLMAEYDSRRREGERFDSHSHTSAAALEKLGRLRTSIDDLLDDEIQAGARAEMAEAERSVEEARRRMQVALSLCFVAFLAVLAVLVATSVIYVTRPFNRLLAGTTAISGGDLSHRIALTGQSEGAIVGRAIDSMAEALQATMVSRNTLKATNQQLQATNEELSNQIAQRERAEDQQRVSEERYRSIFQRSPTAIFRMARSGQVSELNRSFARILGHQETGELKGKRITEIFGETEQLSELLRQLNEHGAVDGMEIQLRRSEGTVFLLASVAIARDEDETRTVYEGTLIDITERKQSEKIRDALQERLARAAEEWSWTFDSISDLVIVLDGENRISRMNEAAKLACRREFEECIGLPVHDVFGKLGTSIEQLSRSALAERKPQTATVRDPDVGTSWSLLVGPRIHEAVGIGAVAVARDSSYMEELEATVRRSQRMAEMGSFVAGVAHEVRNPLFGITANLDAMDLALETNAESLEFSHRVRAEVGRLSELMKDLLDYARPSAAMMELAPIRETVQKAIAATELFARDASVSVECLVDSDEEYARMNEQRVRQALQNLIENALFFSPRGTCVRVDIGSTADHGRSFVTFAVSDCGPGFHDEDVAQALEPFFTRRRGGTGLGLAIVQRVAEDHGGSVSIGRAANGGAKVSFTVSLGSESDAGPGAPQQAISGES